MHKIKQVLNIKTSLMLLGILVLLSGCNTLNSSTTIFKQYTVGVTTYESNEIWVRVE